MDRAINKSTNQIISAFIVFKNGSYQNLDKGEWIAPKDSIYNLEELENKDEPVHYVTEKKFENFRGTKIVTAPYFAVYPGSLAKTTEESPTHKLLKDWLFGRLQNDDIEILFARGVKPHKYENKYKLSQLDINWNDYEIEVTTKGTKRLRADILLPFNNRHMLLGEGIIFEIQLSQQSENQTYERSIERALHGYSVCWLFEKDFIIEEDNINLISNTLNINSFSEQMHFAKKGFVRKLKQVVEEQCRFLDNKIGETNSIIYSLKNENDKVLTQIKSDSESFISKFNLELENKSNIISKKLDSKENLILNSIKNIEQNPFNAIIDSYKIELEKIFETKKIEMIKEYNALVSRLVEQNNILKQNFDYWMKEMNNPTIIGECRVCNSGAMMFKTGKYGDFYGCSNYPRCTNTIKLKRGKYGKVI